LVKASSSGSQALAHGKKHFEAPGPGPWGKWKIVCPPSWRKPQQGTRGSRKCSFPSDVITNQKLKRASVKEKKNGCSLQFSWWSGHRSRTKAHDYGQEALVTKSIHKLTAYQWCKSWPAFPTKSPRVSLRVAASTWACTHALGSAPHPCGLQFPTFPSPPWWTLLRTGRAIPTNSCSNNESEFLGDICSTRHCEENGDLI
jgi:hypothetical protein